VRKKRDKPRQAIYACDVCQKHTPEFEFYAKLTAIWDYLTPDRDITVTFCCSKKCLDERKDSHTGGSSFGGGWTFTEERL